MRRVLRRPPDGIRALTAYEMFGVDVPFNPDPQFVHLSNRDLVAFILDRDPRQRDEEWQATRREIARRTHFHGHAPRSWGARGGHPPATGVREPRKPSPQ